MLEELQTIENKVFCFAIGDGADDEFCSEAAKVGRGEHYCTKN